MAGLSFGDGCGRRPNQRWGRQVGVDDAAVGEEHRAVRVRRRYGSCDHHDRLAELLTHGLTHERENLSPGLGVEAAGGLVGEDDLATARARGDGHALLLTTGEFDGRCERRDLRPTVSTTLSPGLRSLRPARRIGRTMFS